MTLDENGNAISGVELRQHLETLPQELYDLIYDMTFTAESKIRIYSSVRRRDRDRRRDRELSELLRGSSQQVVKLNAGIPHLLHVDRQSREKFAASYFGHPGSVFVFYSVHSPGMCISNAHLRLIRDIRVADSLHLGATLTYLFRELRGTHRALPLVRIDDIVALVEARGGAADEGSSEINSPTAEAPDGNAPY